MRQLNHKGKGQRACIIYKKHKKSKEGREK